MLRVALEFSVRNVQFLSYRRGLMQLVVKNKLWTVRAASCERRPTNNASFVRIPSHAIGINGSEVRSAKEAFVTSCCIGVEKLRKGDTTVRCDGECVTSVFFIATVR